MYLTICRVFSLILVVVHCRIWYSKSMKKIVLVVIIIALGVGGYLYWNALPDPSISTMRKVSAKIGTGEFTLYAPDSIEGLQRGLAIFPEINDNEGMIFRGLPVGVQPFTMKDMKFDIDIIWVDKENTVVHIVYTASKDSYPQRFENPRTRPSAYVIELPAGATDKHGIAPGTVVSISE